MKKEEENDGRKYFSFYFYRTFYRIYIIFFGETTIISFIKKEFIIIFSNQLNENNTISNIII